MPLRAATFRLSIRLRVPVTLAIARGMVGPQINWTACVGRMVSRNSEMPAGHSLTVLQHAMPLLKWIDIESLLVQDHSFP